MIVAQRGGSARIVARRSLRYADGGDPSVGRPPHVRAASGLAWQVRNGQRVLFVPQDDTSFVAVLAPPSGDVSAITLDHAPGGHRVFDKRSGTKELKLDLEAIAAIDDTHTLLVGSGSHRNRRRMVLLDADGSHRIVDCATLYDALQTRIEFAGSELNIEGATRLGDRLWLSNRGNGAAQGDVPPMDAIGSLSFRELGRYMGGTGPAPVLEGVLMFDLGRIDESRLTFTDLAAAPDGSIWFVASAEASPNAYDDGDVAGSAVGRIDLGAKTCTLAVLVDGEGRTVRNKVEGLAVQAISADRVRAYACVDADDPDAPSELLTLELQPPRA